MVGQDDHCVDCERMALANLPECGAQFVNILRQQTQSPIRQVDGEEEAASGYEVATIVGHGQTKDDGFRFALPILRELRRQRISESAAKMRAQERMPLWKLLRSYFSFGEWMLSSSRPKPTSRLSRPSVRLKSATIGIEAPEPISNASLPHSSVSARLAAASGFMFQSSAIAGALE